MIEKYRKKLIKLEYIFYKRSLEEKVSDLKLIFVRYVFYFKIFTYYYLLNLLLFTCYYYLFIFIFFFLYLELFQIFF